MTVTLTRHGEELLESARLRGLGGSPEEIIERALEAVATHAVKAIPAEQRDQRIQAVDDMLLFTEKYKLTLDAGGGRLRDLLHQGHKY
jgi:hypothetical protein